MAVDPSCFRQRIGTKLMHHGLQIARKDKVDVGIIAARSGMPLYESLGFRMAEVVELADDRVGHEAIVELCVCLWSPVVCETAETKEGD